MRAGNEPENTEVQLVASLVTGGATRAKHPAERKLLTAPSLLETGDCNRRFMTEEDIGLFHQGIHLRLYEKLGAHPVTVEGVAGAQFAVWAPNANQVSVIGDFNQWDHTR